MRGSRKFSNFQWGWSTSRPGWVKLQIKGGPTPLQNPSRGFRTSGLSLWNRAYGLNSIYSSLKCFPKHVLSDSRETVNFIFTCIIHISEKKKYFHIRRCPHIVHGVTYSSISTNKWAASWENKQSAYAKTKTQISFAVTPRSWSAPMFSLLG